MADLEGTAVYADFKARALKVATSGLADDPVDHRAALKSHLWMLDRVEPDGLKLTDVGYLKPVDMKATAAVLPTMTGWIFGINTEIHTQAVLYFRQHLMQVGLLRKFKGRLTATRKGRAGLADPEVLWAHLVDTLIPGKTEFAQTAMLIVLVHMATSPGRIDVGLVARTANALGWSASDGAPVEASDVHPFWNDLWAALGNVGDRVESTNHFSDRSMSPEAIAMIRDALFTDTPPTSGNETY